MCTLMVTYLADEGITCCVVEAYAYGYKYCNHDYSNSYPHLPFTGVLTVLARKGIAAKSLIHE